MLNNIGVSKNTYDPPQKIPLITLMVCGYIFLVIERPWESISVLRGVPIELFYAVVMIIVALLQNKFIFVTSPTNKWVYAMLLLHFILAPFAYSSEFAVEQGIEYAKMVILYLLMLSVADEEATLKIVLKSYVFTMIFYSLHSLLEFFNGRHVYRMGISRMIGVDETFSDPNAFGASLVLSLPIAFVLMRFENNTWLRRLYFCYLPLVVFCVIQTGSRTAFVAMIFLLILWIASQQRRQIGKYIFVAILALPIIWVVTPEEKQIRIRTLWDDDAGPANAHESAKGRRAGFIVSWDMFKQVPLTGVGAGAKNFIGYRLANNIDEEGHESATQAHVLYGEVLAEFGIFGTLVFSGLVICIWRSCLYVRVQLQDIGLANSFSYHLAGAILACLLILLLLGFGGHNFNRPLWLWLAAWVGALLNIINKLPSAGDCFAELDAPKKP